MTSDSRKLDEFLQYVTPLGKFHLEFLLYAIRPRESEAVPAPGLSDWPAATSVSRFELADDWWPAVVDKFTFRVPTVPDNLAATLKASMRSVQDSHCLVSWFMFDGGFGHIGAIVDEWSHEWHANQTYGVCFPDAGAHVALTTAERKLPAWAARLDRASELLRSAFPALSGMEL